MIDVLAFELNHNLSHLHLVLTNGTLLTRFEVFAVVKFVNLLLGKSL